MAFTFYPAVGYLRECGEWGFKVTMLNSDNGNSIFKYIVFMPA
jgi:hypothetical protein